MKNNTPTPHISAKKNEISQTVLLPGDPLRAKMIAENFLEDAKLVSSVRNNYCYTGKYKNKTISVMSTGMGCPSMGIYSYELLNFYNIKNAIRIGSIGSLRKDIKLKDIIVAESCYTNTNYLNNYIQNGEQQLYCDNELLEKLKITAKNNKTKIKVCDIYSTDTFYNSKQEDKHEISLNVAGAEMECAALYLNAQKANKKAICICTVSDERISGKSCTSKEREQSFKEMITLALDLCLSL